MGATASTDRSRFKEVVPSWVYTVKIPADYAEDKLMGCSDGMQMVGTNTVQRRRTGHFDTDAAKWGRGFTSGKHTFEIVYPMSHRGMEATVGVGTETAPLHAKGRVALVGHNKHSWGICLRARRAFHKNSIVKKYPQTQVYLPDKFYMYLDVDAGLLQFGSDLDYYGTAISGIPRQQPLYPMVAASTQGATITMVYRGMGNTDDIGVAQQPQPGGVVVVVPAAQSVVAVAPTYTVPTDDKASAPPPPPAYTP